MIIKVGTVIFTKVIGIYLSRLLIISEKHAANFGNSEYYYVHVYYSALWTSKPVISKDN